MGGGAVEGCKAKLTDAMGAKNSTPAYVGSEMENQNA